MKNTITCLFLVLTTLFCNFLNAQKIDEILMKAYYSKDSSDYYFKVAKSMIKTPKDAAQYYFCKSSNMDLPIDSIAFYSKIATKKLKEVKDYPSQITLYNNLGFAYQKNGQFDLAVQNGLEALKISEEINDVFFEGYSCGTLSEIYHEFEFYDKGIEYGKKSLNKLLKVESISNNHIKNALNIIAINFDDSNQPDSALVYHFKILDYYKDQDTLQLNSTYNNIGNSYLKKENYKLSEKWLKRSLKILEAKDQSKQNEFHFGSLSTTYINLATIAYMTKNYDKAADLFDKAAISTQKSNDVSKKLDFYKRLTIFNKKRKDFEGAVKSQEQYIALRDSIFEKDRLKLVADFETKYQTEKKEKELLLTNNKLIKNEVELQKEKLAVQNKNNTILMISVGSGFILLFGFGFYRRKQLEQKAILAAEQTKQRELITQAVIEAEETERKRIASDLHDGVGQLFSAVKMNLGGLLKRVEITKDEDRFLAEKTMALVDESCKEVRVISHKIMPNFLLKSGIASDIKSFIEKIDENTLKISFESNGFKEQLEFNEEIILYRVIQELINNVIKHAKANELHIVLNKTKQNIQVKIIDNGVGFDYEKALEKGGLGLKNILVRIEYLKGKVHFSSHRPSGTVVQIDVPIG